MGCCTLLKVQEIREIIKLVDNSSIQEFSYEQNGAKISMKKTGNESLTTKTVYQAPVAVQAVQSESPASTKTEITIQNAPESNVVQENNKTVVNKENVHKITSPMVGTYYQSSSPDTPPYVNVGSKVTEDDVVCIVEAMKLFNEITADVTGEIVEILVKDGQLVEYGQPLFLVKT